jgi:hypothetical protein
MPSSDSVHVKNPVEPQTTMASIEILDEDIPKSSAPIAQASSRYVLLMAAHHLRSGSAGELM